MVDAAEGLRSGVSGRRLSSDAGHRSGARLAQVGYVLSGQPGSRPADCDRPRLAFGRFRRLTTRGARRRRRYGPADGSGSRARRGDTRPPGR